MTSLRTGRLLLRPFTPADREPFYVLNTHPEVVASLGSTPTRESSDAVVDLFLSELATEGWGIWAVEVPGLAPFVGMTGLHRVSAALPCAPAVEIGWRLHPDHWGAGYATEAATMALAYGFDRDQGGALEEIVSFTTTLNARSAAVMARIGMRRDPGGDFDHPALPEDSPLRRHVLYRVRAESWDLAPADLMVQPG